MYREIATNLRPSNIITPTKTNQRFEPLISTNGPVQYVPLSYIYKRLVAAGGTSDLLQRFLQVTRLPPLKAFSYIGEKTYTFYLLCHLYLRLTHIACVFRSFVYEYIATLVRS